CAPVYFTPVLPSAPTATPPPSSLSLHDALPILPTLPRSKSPPIVIDLDPEPYPTPQSTPPPSSNPFTNADILLGTHIDTLTELRSEEHTSELQSRENLVCRLLLEKINTSY